MWPWRKKKIHEKTFDSGQMEEAYYNIAEMIAKNDANVLVEIKEGFAYPQKYLEKLCGRFTVYYIDEIMKNCVRDKWWLMIDVLEQHNYICTRDWKDELEDFLYFLFRTKRAVAENIRFADLNLVLSEKGDIAQWGKAINNKLAEKNFVIGYIGTEGDEYTIFLCTKQELACLEERASLIHQLICSLSD